VAPLAPLTRPTSDPVTVCAAVTPANTQIKQKAAARRKNIIRFIIQISFGFAELKTKISVQRRNKLRKTISTSLSNEPYAPATRAFD
jgi:hypothetical protein